MIKNLANETSLIIAVLAMALAILDFAKKDNSRARKLVSGVLCLAVIALMVNYIYVRQLPETRKVPDIVGLTYGSAKLLIRDRELTEKPLTDGSQILNDDMSVIVQNPDAFTEVEVGSEILLVLAATENNEQNQRNKMESNTNSELLSLRITDCKLNSGFHYEYPNPDELGSYWVIDLQAGLSGTFTYSRQLTEDEKEDWMHGGKLYDAKGNEVGSENNYPSFWSNQDGMFAVGFPQNLPTGEYRYELYQFVGGQYVSDSITFTI